MKRRALLTALAALPFLDSGAPAAQPPSAPLSSAPLSSADEAAVAGAFEALRDAARNGDGKRLVAGLSKDTTARLEAVRAAARRPGGAARLSPAERLAAGGLRRATTPADLNRKGLDELAAMALSRRGAFGRELDKAGLGPLRVTGDRAAAALLVDKQPTLFSADFVRESGAWKLDLRPALKRGDMLLTGMAAIKGTSEDALIEAILSQMESRMRKTG